MAFERLAVLLAPMEMEREQLRSRFKCQREPPATFDWNMQILVGAVIMRYAGVGSRVSGHSDVGVEHMSLAHDWTLLSPALFQGPWRWPAHTPTASHMPILLAATIVACAHSQNQNYP